MQERILEVFNELGTKYFRRGVISGFELFVGHDVHAFYRLEEQASQKSNGFLPANKFSRMDVSPKIKFYLISVMSPKPNF